MAETAAMAETAETMAARAENGVDNCPKVWW